MQNPASKPTTSAQALPAGARLGNYIIINQLGSGGFGITYLAEHSDNQLLYVIKENLPAQCARRDLDSYSVIPHENKKAEEDYIWCMNSFFQEAHTLASLSHQYIVRIEEAFYANNTAYFVMPFVKAKDLWCWSEMYDTPYTPNYPLALENIFAQIIQTLSYIHGHNICHRDLKPANILITENHCACLIDFGAARAMISDKTQTIMASMDYAPYEQLLGNNHRATPQEDFYALGATFYHVITRQVPTQSGQRLLSLKSSHSDSLAPLVADAELCARYHQAFLASIDWCLQLEAEQRPPSAQHLSDYLYTKQQVDSPYVPTINLPHATSLAPQALRNITTKIIAPPAAPKAQLGANVAKKTPYISSSSKKRIQQFEERKFTANLLCVVFGMSSLLMIIYISTAGGKADKQTEWILFSLLCIGFISVFTRRIRLQNTPNLIHRSRTNQKGQREARIAQPSILELMVIDTHSGSTIIRQSLPSNSRWSLNIGREAQRCQVVLPDPKVSRVHARINYDGQQLSLQDLDSQSGAFLNQRRIPSNQDIPFAPSDILHIRHFAITLSKA